MTLDIRISKSTDRDFLYLTGLLDEDLNKRYQELQKSYDKHNRTDNIKQAVILYDGEVPIACGAYKEHRADSVELKRIFVRQEYRGQGLSKLLVRELESLAKADGYRAAFLETGRKQQEAISLYEKSGYHTYTRAYRKLAYGTA